MERITLPEQSKAAAYVSYRAGNRLLILPGQAEIQPWLADLSAHFQISCLSSPSGGLHTRLHSNAMAVEILTIAGPAQVQGHLGQFGVAGLDGYRFDLVLDLQESPSINSTIAPPGYYRLHNSDRTPADIVEELPDMIGQFDKPKYFNLQNDKCAHSRREIEGCRQCIDICATDAIGIAGDTIQVNPYLCQGCGDCATVCPAGAINYQYPKRSDTLLAIKDAFIDYPAVLLLYSGDEPLIETEFPVKAMAVEALGACGLDVWMGALAYGASQIWLFDGGDLTAETRKALTEQIGQGEAILTGLGYPEGMIQLAEANAFRFLQHPSVERARFAVDEDKRTMIRHSVEHLAQQMNAGAQVCPLPNPASFGAIEVSTNDCTLCMSCVSVCPEQALMAGSETPLLKFIEANCVQCGICAKACPEQAIDLQPRYLVDNKAAREPRLLHREQPFHCIECGEPFATRSMIMTILEKLEHHPMFQGDKKRRLMLCEHCKVTAMFEK